MSNLHDVFQNIGDQFAEFGPVAIIVMAALGLVLVGIGIFLIIRGSKNVGGGSTSGGRWELGFGFTSIVCGALLMNVARIASITSSSIVGSGASAGLGAIGL